MPRAPTPSEIFDRAVEEGERRLDQSTLELVSTSFLAGFTIVFGLVALGIVEAAVEPRFGAVAELAGALAFGLGLVLLVVSRTELFNENFLDPAAAAVDRSGSWLLWPLFRLWIVTLVFNLVGGALFAFVFSIEGALPPGTAEILLGIAEESAHRGHLSSFARAIAGGTLVGLLSYMLVAVDTSGSRICLAYVIGFLLALGPFEHVVVTLLHLYFGVLFGAAIGVETLAIATVITTAGNLVGGLGLVTFTHVTQVRGTRERGE